MPKCNGDSNQKLYIKLTWHYMYFFFLDELRKFTISDFPKQMHLGYILITLFFFLHPLIDPHFAKMFFVLAALAQAIG